MVDAIAILLTHSLILVAFWRLRLRDDLDGEEAPEMRHKPQPFGWRSGNAD